jgi:hypothetical protein
MLKFAEFCIYIKNDIIEQMGGGNSGKFQGDIYE